MLSLVVLKLVSGESRWGCFLAPRRDHRLEPAHQGVLGLVPVPISDTAMITTIVGLTNGIIYQVRVRAINDANHNPNSAAGYSA